MSKDIYLSESTYIYTIVNVFFNKAETDSPLYLPTFLLFVRHLDRIIIYTLIVIRGKHGITISLASANFQLIVDRPQLQMAHAIRSEIAKFLQLFHDSNIFVIPREGCLKPHKKSGS